MNFKRALFSLALIAGAMSSFGARTQAREVYFDRVISLGEDDLNRLTRIVDRTGTGDTALYQATFSSPPGNQIGLSNGTTSPPGDPPVFKELSFDSTATTDDDGWDFRLDAVITRPGAAVTVSTPGPVTIDAKTFATSILLSDSSGVSPPVLLSFLGELAPDVSFNSSVSSPLLQTTGNGSFSMLFGLTSSFPPGSVSEQHVFSSLLVTAEAVPEPSTLLLAMLGGFATWRMTKTRRRTSPQSG